MHRKEIRSLKKKAAIAYKQGKKKEAYEIWEKAAKERAASQLKKQAKALKLGKGD